MFIIYLPNEGYTVIHPNLTNKDYTPKELENLLDQHQRKSVGFQQGFNTYSLRKQGKLYKKDGKFIIESLSIDESKSIKFNLSDHLFNTKTPAEMPSLSIEPEKLKYMMLQIKK